MTPIAFTAHLFSISMF